MVTKKIRTMSTVAIIDDRKDVRERLAKRIARHLKDENLTWKTVPMEPLPNPQDYQKWIVHEKIIFILVDERLTEEKLSNSSYNSYNGHDLVKEIRLTNKQLPIFMITAHPHDEQIEEMKGEFDDVISRTNLEDKESSRQYVKRFVRSTQTYLSNFQKEYERLAKLSELVALEQAKEVEINELKALQAKLEIPLSAFISKDRTDWLAELDKKTQEIEGLAAELDALIKKNNGK